MWLCLKINWKFYTKQMIVQKNKLRTIWRSLQYNKNQVREDLSIGKTKEGWKFSVIPQHYTECLSIAVLKIYIELWTFAYHAIVSDKKGYWWLRLVLSLISFPSQQSESLFLLFVLCWAFFLANHSRCFLSIPWQLFLRSL